MIGLQLAKFNRSDDRWNNTRGEYAMLQLAQGCGIGVAASKPPFGNQNRIIWLPKPLVRPCGAKVRP
jgi:hypothetical protein